MKCCVARDDRPRGLATDRVCRVAAALAVLAAGLALSSCGSYYAIEATLPAPVTETNDAIGTAVRNISDMSLIEDATAPTDSATLRYIGLQGVPASNGKVVRTLPKFAIRLQPEGTQSTMAVTSVGGDQYAKLVIIATEQELQRRALIRSDSTGVGTAVGALAFKSTWLHQLYNAITPALGMWYVQEHNPYTSPTAKLELAGVAAADAVGLYLMATTAAHTFSSGPWYGGPTARHYRDQQYKFVIGMVISMLLRYNFGTTGFLQVQQYNALADAPYNLESGYIDSRIQTIGISVRFP